MKDSDDVDRVVNEFIHDEVFFETFDGVLPNLEHVGAVESAESANAWGSGDLLEGGFGGVEKSIACVEVIDADVVGVGDEILDDDRPFDQVRHRCCVGFGVGGRWHEWCPSRLGSWEWRDRS